MNFRKVYELPFKTQKFIYFLQHKAFHSKCFFNFNTLCPTNETDRTVNPFKLWRESPRDSCDSDLKKQIKKKVTC